MTRREHLAAMRRDPDIEAKRVANSKAALAIMRRNPQAEAKRLDKLRAALRTPEMRALRRALALAQWSDPGALRARNAKLRQAALRRASDPDELARLKEMAIRGNITRWGNFLCPPHLKRLYRKLRAALGLEAAREAIRAEIRREKWPAP